jgi:hypothetical protein
MYPDRAVWALACELARSGAYENIVTIELELRQRGRLGQGEITHNTYWREYLTRLCHAARDGMRVEAQGRRDSAIRAAVPADHR